MNFGSLFLVVGLFLLFIYLNDHWDEVFNRNPCKERQLKIGCNGLSSGIYWIDVGDINRYLALCDNNTAGGGWIVVQRRFDGSELFNRSWSEFRDGFGNIDGEFFIGLEQLHQITNWGRYELYIEMGYFNGPLEFASYDDFRIGNESYNYVLESLGDYIGTSRENLIGHSLNQSFSTYDCDNDKNQIFNCALNVSAGWWYDFCFGTNLNRRYFPIKNQFLSCISWDPLGGRCLESVKLLIRPKC